MRRTTKQNARKGETSQVREDDDDGDSVSSSAYSWTPSAHTAFKCLLSARLCAAIWSGISDCDETFNYWEPMHFLMFGQGMQTWEYSPQYSLRSYAYLWLHVIPLKVYSAILQPNKVMLFYFLRCLFGFVSSLAEVYFYKSICYHFGKNTGRITLCFLVFAPGMFISSTAFLPSSFAMYMTMLAVASWLNSSYSISILAVGLGTLVGWPFAGIIGVPIAIDMVLRRGRIGEFMKWTLVWALAILFPLITIDSYYYGRLTVTPWKLVEYNIFTQHGPNLYGVEPWSYYFFNGFLNFNFVFVLALFALPLTAIVQSWLCQSDRAIPLWLTLMPLYLWVVVFFTRPHKEERFLFPVYPLICLAGAVCFDALQKVVGYTRARLTGVLVHYTELTNTFALFSCGLYAVLCVSRILALFFGYHAPLDVYGSLGQLAANTDVHTIPLGRTVNLCVGKEWYRFPSSYFLPNENWQLQFIKSKFSGQLPKPYAKGARATRIFPRDMNDQNREEPSRYINVTQCHYLVDLDVAEEAEYEPRYSTNSKEWRIVASEKFLDNSRSPRLYRAFYIPFVSAKHTHYINYNLLQSVKLVKRS
jgi:alpha-1,2-mannosyltransferase